MSSKIIPEIGIVRDLPFEDYAAEPAINSGMITMFCKGKTPAHIKAKYIDKKISFESDDLDFGRKAHCVILESKRFQARHVVMPKFVGPKKDGSGMSDRSEAAKEKRDKWLAALPPDVIIVSEEDAETLTAMMNELLKKEFIRNILSEGASEVSGFWIDEESGARCKFRADFINMVKHALVDYKTARDGRHDDFRDQLEKLYYHVQLFHYKTGANSLQIPIDDLIVLAQEKTYPFLPNTFYLNEVFIDDAKARWRSALNQLALCQKSGEWPGFPDKINELLPSNRLMYREII